MELLSKYLLLNDYIQVYKKNFPKETEYPDPEQIVLSNVIIQLSNDINQFNRLTTIRVR